MALSELNRRRWRSFRRNKRAFWSLIIFTVLFVASLFAELIANDRPIMVSYKGEYYFPVYRFYPETAFGGDFGTEAIYTDPGVQCLIKTGGCRGVLTSALKCDIFCPTFRNPKQAVTIC